MSKTKMRCNVCGKWFQSANAKDLTCPDCTQKARKEKLAAKQAPAAQGQTTPGTGVPPRQVPPPPPKPKPATPGGTSHWLDAQNDVKIGQPDQPVRPKIPSSPTPRENRGGQERSDQYSSGPSGYRDRDERGPAGPSGPGGYRERGPGGYRERDRDERGSGSPGGYRGPGGYRENDYRGPSNYRPPAPYRVGGGMGLPDTIGQRPRQPMPGTRPPRPGGPGGPGGPGEGRIDRFRPGGKPGMPKAKKPPKPKSEMPPKPKREKIPPPEPFRPTDEQIAQVENRYLELAVPTEYDGIRTQIAHELGIPKTAVKKIVKNLRDRDNIPSWWEIQTYKGSEEELEKIKAVYEPFLPLPPVGVHKQIAEQLELKPGEVYQAIKKIRLDMNLPQYNDPALHGLVLRSAKKDEQSNETASAEQTDAEQSQSSDQSGSTEPLAEGQKPDSDLGIPTEPLAAEKQSEKQKADTDQPVPTEPQAEEKKSEEQKADSDAEQAVPAMPTPTASTPQAEPQGEFSSIETDVKFRQVGDTTEVIGASAQDNTPES